LTVATAAGERFCPLFLQNVARICALTACIAAAVWPAASQTAPGAVGQTGATVERIEFDGNRRIRSETLQARIFTLLQVPSDGDMVFRFGLYDLTTGQRLARTDAPGDAYELRP